MPQVLKATYRNGAFILQTPCNLPDGLEVELLLQSPQVIPPKISDLNARQNFLKLLLLEGMQENPIPVTPPRLTRDMLHERR